MKYPLLIAMLLIGVLAATMASTSASFNDTVTSSGNSYDTQTLPAPSLNPPVVSGSGSTATVQLSWTDSGIADEWQVLRLSGACGTPSAVVATVVTTSHTNAPGAAGTYCYAIKGKFNNWLSAGSNTRQVTIGTATPALTLTATPTTADEGDTLNATASVTGGSSPTGSVTFNLYRPGECGGTPAYTQTVALVSGSASTSPGFTSDEDGTWHWTASYGGDINNSATSVGCPGATVVVSPAGPPPVDQLKFDSASPGTGVCSAARTLRPSSATTTGFVDIGGGSTVTWIGLAGDGLTVLPAGTYSGSLERLVNPSGPTSARTVTVAIGVCDAGTYVEKGVTTGISVTGSASTNPFSVDVASSTVLDADTLVVVRITNASGSMGGPNFRLDTDGSSFINAPGDLN